jgi:hypothetical protein
VEPGDASAIVVEGVGPDSTVVRISIAAGLVAGLTLSLVDVVGILAVSDETILATEMVESWDVEATAAQLDGWMLEEFDCGRPPSPPLEFPCEVALGSLETRRPS